MNVGELYNVHVDRASLWTDHETSGNDRPMFADAFVKRYELVMILSCDKIHIRVEVLTKTGVCGWLMRQYLGSTPIAR